jgi:hypothetical protein
VGGKLVRLACVEACEGRPNREQVRGLEFPPRMMFLGFILPRPCVPPWSRKSSKCYSNDSLL